MSTKAFSITGCWPKIKDHYSEVITMTIVTFLLVTHRVGELSLVDFDDNSSADEDALKASDDEGFVFVPLMIHIILKA